MTLRHSTAASIALWDHPSTLGELCKLFVDYCRGEVKMLPWSDFPLAPESNSICPLLAGVNARGFLTINSQPPVNGVPSSHAVHGWGPRHGYVYQKAYVECFASPALLSALESRLARVDAAAGGEGVVTYHAVNRAGELRSNHNEEVPNAVTWGVFPGQEVVQPTVVDVVSFLAWKDEAFGLWDSWSHVYDEGSPSRKLLSTVSNEFWLINLVHNDFHQPARALFDILLASAQDANGIPKCASVEAALGSSLTLSRKTSPEPPQIGALELTDTTALAAN
jgi:methylenetetrahydrofolate reductase (NADPH)